MIKLVSGKRCRGICKTLLLRDRRVLSSVSAHPPAQAPST